MCFFSVFRAGEITLATTTSFDITQHLAWGDVTIEPANAKNTSQEIKDRPTGKRSGHVHWKNCMFPMSSKCLLAIYGNTRNRKLSFRIGAVTSAAQAGIKDSTIRKMERWNNSAFLAYVRTPRDHLAAFSNTLANITVI